MRNNILLAATAAAALLAGTAVGHADTLAGGPLPPASSSGFALVTCTLFNAGPTAVPLTSAAIVGLNGQPVQLLTTPTTPPGAARASPPARGASSRRL
jgi:hypothetical protein